MGDLNHPAPAAPMPQAPWPDVDFSQFGEVGETLPLSRIQKLTASYLSRNWSVIPHVTHHDEADITDLELRRKQEGEAAGRKLTLTPYLMKALAELLAKYPQFNASLDASGQQLVFKKYFHVGMAVDTPNGLVVAVLRDCDRKNVPELAQEIEDLAAKAKGRGLPMKDMVGGCITISSLGHIGGTAFTPIVNAPEVAILGVTRAQWKPRRGKDDAVEWRLMLPLSLSYDHRVINGADAARFTADLARLLA
ncbi:dihydrolipoamide acetyltransferase (plasmid) [Diaphorobacter sp. HDW4B]|uniref:2-oxo acid dehydrogenase subunit E2 n=1 Tax=Diaphorobacter sp. HDW4B TaxID=2714925 RepID=UPI00140ADA07|nr:2-oxo acid dehydrogenase subunit E2 [Diaphorobacter sp. HDW4B]QIL73994.1 dihydrolipoamide acetyltransferase [Diaphorobacter sp. HDW4B]